MATDPHKKAKMSAADKEAYKRLRAIWDGFAPRKDRPRQDTIADDIGSQSAVSQYLTGRIPLNYHAVMVFAKHLKCKPEDIRDDLPEQKILAASRAPSSSVTEVEMDQIWSSYPAQAKMLALALLQGFTQQFTPPPTQEEKNAPQDRSRSARRNSG
jgi:hypothetical protein